MTSMRKGWENTKIRAKRSTEAVKAFLRTSRTVSRTNQIRNSADSGGADGVPNWNFVPKGLYLLTNLKFMTVRQVEDENANVRNATLDSTSPNFYLIHDEHGNRIFQVVEKTEIRSIIERGNKRRYLLAVNATSGDEVMVAQRMHSCFSDGVECVLADGTLLGGVKGTEVLPCFCCKRYFDIYDSSFTIVLCLEDEGCCSREFTVVKASDKSSIVAYITKRYEDSNADGYSDADVFILEFKGVHELSPVMKAVLITAIFFLDFKHFEDIRVTHIEQDATEEKRNTNTTMT